MLFNSLQFLIFFPLVTILYYLLPHRFRWVLLLGASCYFYMAFVPYYILILAFTISVDYTAGIWIEKSTGRRRQVFLLASLVANIGVLAFFKYFNFTNANLAALAVALRWNYPIQNLSILLPIGLSFHTFQSLSYTIEVYRGKFLAEKHLGYLALYVLYYPQLVAGPIERPQNILPQLHQEHRFDYQNVTDGLKQMGWGFFKKLVVADRLAVFVNLVYGNLHSSSALTMWMATLAFSIQIYCDFSGYSDIAIGASRVMGIRLMKNFDHPYFARSIQEFWRRWHISLSTWFKDYVYIPLGGNRVAKHRWILNVLITFLISGLWHGANWTYIIWGALHGVLNTLNILFVSMWDKLTRWTRLEKIPWLCRIIETGTTFLLVTLAWVFFRASSVSEAFYILENLGPGLHLLVRYTKYLLQGRISIATLFETSSSLGLANSDVFFIVFSLIILFAVEVGQYQGDLLVRINRYSPVVRWSLYSLLVIGILLLGKLFSAEDTPFIYFQF